MPAEPRYALADELAADPVTRREPMVRNGTLMRSEDRRDAQVRRAPSGTGLYDVLDLILDKGIVIDAFVRVSLVGIELVTIDLRVVIASVDTYLRYAEGVERLQLNDRSKAAKLSDIAGGGMKTAAISKGAKSIGKALGGGGGKNGNGKHDDDDDDQEGDGGIGGTLTRGVRNVVGKVVGSLTGGDDDDDEGGDEDGAKQGQERGQQRGGGAPAKRQAAGGGNRK